MRIFCWVRSGDSYTDTILGYANSIRTSDGGTHLDGMKAAITRTLNTLGRKAKILKVRDLFAMIFVVTHNCVHLARTQSFVLE